jgi:hypothetical protein
VKTHRTVFLALGLALLLQGLDDAVVPPVLIHQAEPQYGADLQKAFLVDHVRIEVVVDRDGQPFAVEAAAGIPEPVVQAISQWRFKPGTKGGKNEPFKIAATMAVRESLSGASEQNLRRQWHAPYTDHTLNDDLRAGESFSQAQATSAEGVVEKNPADIDTRAKLIAYYASEAGDKAENRAARLRHLTWLATNQPQADLLGSPLVSVPAPGNPLQDDEGYKALSRVWLDQTSGPVLSVPVAGNASNFLRLADPEATEKMLLSLTNKSDQAETWLADLYALSALGVRGVDMKNGRANLAGESLPVDGFGAKAQQKLLSSAANTRILFTGLATVTAAGRSLTQAGHLPNGYAEFCQKLLQQARAVYPETKASCETGPEAAKEDIQLLRIGGKVQEASLIRKVQPQYPAEAKQRHITGMVEFTAVIGDDGKIRDLLLVRGPLALYQSTRDAVSKWEYKPVHLNGKPVGVITNIVVNYGLGF